MGATLSTILPGEDDLPSGRWLALDEGLVVAGDGGGPAEQFDCVGPDFPSGAEVVVSEASPHFVRPPGRLLHGFGIEAATDDAADRAERSLTSARFAQCLAEAVAADLAPDPGSSETRAADPRQPEPELLAADVSVTGRGHRVTFTGGTGDGIRPVVLDVVCVRDGRRVGLLWFADTPDPFPDTDVDHVLVRLAARRR